MQAIKLDKIKKILITRTDRIGDLVLSTPVFPAIKKRFPNAYVAAMVFKETAPILRGNPFIDEIIIYDKKSDHQNWIKTCLFGFGLRKKHFDVVVHLHPTNRANLISWLAGIPVRIGYQKKNYKLLTHTMREEKEFGRRHESDYVFDLLAFLGVKKPWSPTFYFPLIPEEREKLLVFFEKGLTDRYAVFHPSASCVSKRWPAERFAQTADRMAQEFGILPVLIGEGPGIEDAGKMQSYMKEKSLNLAGKLTLETLGWLLKGARLLISNDSGPVHIASALGTPVISIFGRNRPGLNTTRWRPLSENSSYLQKDVGCVECLAHKCEIDFKCLKELTVSDVLDEVDRYEALLV